MTEENDYSIGLYECGAKTGKLHFQKRTIIHCGQVISFVWFIRLVNYKCFINDNIFTVTYI